YEANGIELRVATRICRIDRARRELIDAAGAVLAYDTLVLATGSAPFVPPIAGVETPRGFVYRTIGDLYAILYPAARARPAARHGGGLLGLEAARAVHDLGLETHVIELSPRLMPRQLDAAGGALLALKLRALGVHVHLGARIAAIGGADRVREVEL